VISMTAPYTHAWSAQTLLGPAPDPALVARRSPVQHVSAQTPPVFLVHALDDDAVPYQNSLDDGRRFDEGGPCARNASVCRRKARFRHRPCQWLCGTMDELGAKMAGTALVAAPGT
jgi:hypothetical protein